MSIGSVVQVDIVHCQYCMSYENNLPIFVGRNLKQPLFELWPQLKRYI